MRVAVPQEEVAIAYRVRIEGPESSCSTLCRVDREAGSPSARPSRRRSISIHSGQPLGVALCQGTTLACESSQMVRPRSRPTGAVNGFRSSCEHLLDRSKVGICMRRSTRLGDGERSRSVRLNRLWVIVASLLLFASALPAWAEYNGCKFPGTNPVIQYQYFSVGWQAQSWHDAGASAWNSSSADGSFSEISSGDEEIRIYDDYYAWSHNAITAGGCSSGGAQPWTGDLVEIEYNLSELVGRSFNENKMTAVHELGHAYGLAHDLLPHCAINRTVMATVGAWVGSNCGDWSAPYSSDVSDVNALY